MLGAAEVGAHDDFFEMGGHSLMAANLFSRIEQEFGRKLPLDALFHAPTPASFSRLLREPGAVAALSRIVPMQPKGSLSPFFMVRPLPIYRPLARRFPQDRPFLGITLPDGKQFAFKNRLMDVAADLVGIIRRRQPSGPYYLGGWCADGVLSYEIARQLESQGERIALLALFDSLNPEHMPALPRRRLTKRMYYLMRRHLKFHLASLRQLERQEIAGYIRERLKALLILIRSKFSVSQSDSKPHLQEIDDAAWRPSGMRIWISGYRPVVLKGQIVLFRSMSWRRHQPEDACLGWDALAGNRLAVYQIPGDHLSIFLEPNVETLAEKLAESMAGSSV
ncbi:MAG: hypothetical protein JXA73_17915 [Acidobacteria bacterium]|nr:hypothetical protein [Acidobacteriota bacterium]